MRVIINKFISKSTVEDNFDNLIDKLKLILLEFISTKPLSNKIFLDCMDTLFHQLGIIFNDILASKDTILIHL